MNKLILLFIIIFSTITQALGSGVVTVSGKLVSITKTQFIVEMNDSTYYMNRKAVHPIEAEKLTKLGVMVSVAVPFEGIESVKSNQKSQKK